MVEKWLSSPPAVTVAATICGGWNLARPGSEELLLEAPDGSWFGPSDFSDNGRFLLVQQFISVDDSRIYVLDLEERVLYLVAGNPEFPSANKAISFDRQGTGFYFITNQRGRAAELAWRALEAGLGNRVPDPWKPLGRVRVCGQR